MSRLLAWLGVVLATVTLAAATAAQEPPGPAFASDYRYQFTPNFGRSINFCASQLATVPNNRPAHELVLDLLSNPFLRPLDTPIDQFQSPSGWAFRPDPARNAWRVSSSDAMQIGLEYCFVAPVNRALLKGEVVRIHAGAQNGDDLYYFTSQQVVPKAKRGELPVYWDLLLQDVTGFYTSPSSACGLVRNFNTGLRISADNNFGKIVQPSTGDTVQGAVNPKTYTFKFVGPTEVYEGGIKGIHLWASYGYTRIFGGGPCTAGYLAHITLSKPATIAPACKRPQIVAPRTAVYRAGRVRIRFAARCAGQYVAGLRLKTRLVIGTQVRGTGSFTTKAQPAPVTIGPFKREELNPPRPRDRFIEFRSPAQMGLGPAVKRVEIRFR